jgi:hypothetical protein
MEWRKQTREENLELCQQGRREKLFVSQHLIKSDPKEK